jgi:hypothetical protein
MLGTRDCSLPTVAQGRSGPSGSHRIGASGLCRRPGNNTNVVAPGIFAEKHRLLISLAVQRLSETPWFTVVGRQAARGVCVFYQVL